MQGTVAEPCAEGGEDLGYVDTGDWAVWDADVRPNGTYIVDRVASQSGGGVIQLERPGGSPIYGSIGPRRRSGRTGSRSAQGASSGAAAAERDQGAGRRLQHQPA